MSLEKANPTLDDSAESEHKPDHEARTPNKKSNKPKGKPNSASKSKLSKSEMLANEFSKLCIKTREFSAETGIVYDERMSEHHCLWDPNYPECPERFIDSLKRCQHYRLVDRCRRIPSRAATEEELLLQHGSDLVEIVKNTSGSTDNDALEQLSSKYDAIYFHPSTYELALLSVGCTVDLVTEVVTGKLKNGMALIRPPGHHAMHSEACGYCFFNNVAIAAKHAVDKLGVKRVLIVDWDVHHGQASQYMFYDDPRVLYFSIHRYENGSFWPNLRESDYDHVGQSKGKGFNFNVPLNKTGLGNSEYMAIFHQVLLPVATEFCPELVIVSAGYDAAIGCFEGYMEVTPACYANFTSSLMSLAEGKVCVILEGGYCLQSLSEGVALTLRALLGDPCPPLGPLPPPDPVLVDSIMDVMSVQRPFWKCFRYQGVISDRLLRSDNEWPNHVPEIKFLGPETKPSVYATRDCYPLQDSQEIVSNRTRIDALIAETNMAVCPNRTCLVYDEKMMLHRNYIEPSHPERPTRIAAILAMHENYGLLRRCLMLKSREATIEEVKLLHGSEYVDELLATVEMKPRDIVKFSQTFRSIFMCTESLKSALLAAGSLFQVLDHVLTGQSQNGAAFIRPPGHHAEIDEACGFCFFNNVALAAQLALTRYNLQRVLILDWDVHHGNGIQHMFYNDPRVLYISLHRFDDATFFPNLDDADYQFCGEGNGVGFNVNIPWNTPMMTDGDYMSAFHHVVLPIAYQFNPELVLVSAGFDAAIGDPLGNCALTPQGYARMTHLLSGLANGRVILALEGGYNLVSLAHSMANCTSVLLGDPCPSLPPGLHPSPSAVRSIRNVLSVQKKHWSSLKYQVNLPPVPGVKEEQDMASGDTAAVVGSETDLLIDQVQRLSVSDLAEYSSDSFSPSPVKPKKLCTEVNNDTMDKGSASNSQPASEGQTALNILLEAGGDEGIMYAVEPLPGCPHLEVVQPLPSPGFDIKSPCQDCQGDRENWICLTCYQVHCGRFVKQHMLQHHDTTGHCMTLSFTDLSVWCYGCEAYIHNEILLPAISAARQQKFGSSLPQ